jgi:hypothetical protein
MACKPGNTSFSASMLGVGIALGAGFGVALHNVGIGIAIGVAIGVALGSSGRPRKS